MGPAPREDLGGGEGPMSDGRDLSRVWRRCWRRYASACSPTTEEMGGPNGLCFAGNITDETFGVEDRRLRAQIATLEDEAAARRADQEHPDELVERFEEATELLASFVDEVWEEAPRLSGAPPSKTWSTQCSSTRTRSWSRY